MPLSATNCLTQVFCGRPWRRVQSGLGLVPKHMSTLSLRAKWPGTSAGSLLIWPKREWRLRAMLFLISVRPVLSETVTLVTKSHQRTPSSWRWHLMWKACSFFPFSLSSIQVSEPYNRTGRTHACLDEELGWLKESPTYCSIRCRVAPLRMLPGRYCGEYLEMSSQMSAHHFQGKWTFPWCRCCDRWWKLQRAVSLGRHFKSVS